MAVIGPWRIDKVLVMRVSCFAVICKLLLFSIDVLVQEPKWGPGNV